MSDRDPPAAEPGDGHEPGGPSRTGILTALGHRDFALIWSGSTVSSIGDGVFTIALALEALRLDHSPAGLAFVLAARSIPRVLLALVGGVVVDRIPRRLAMLISDVGRGLAVGIVALLVAHGDPRLWELIAMSVIFGIADAFFSPASMAYLPEILPPELLVQGNALNSTSGQLTEGLIGPALGGLLVAAAGSSWAFGLDAISFGVSVACLTLMRAGGRPEPSGRSPFEDAKVGLAYVRSRRWLAVSIPAASLANFFGIMPLAVLLPILVRQTLHGGALALGLVFAAGGATGVVASLVVARLGNPPNRVAVMWTAYAVGSVGIAGMGLAPNVVVVGVLSAVEIGLILYGDVLWVTMVQELVPKELLGRVSSLIFLFAFGLGPLGLLEGGFFAATIGPRSALVLSGIVSGAICLLPIFLPGANPDRAPALEDSPVGATE